DVGNALLAKVGGQLLLGQFFLAQVFPQQHAVVNQQSWGVLRDAAKPGEVVLRQVEQVVPQDDDRNHQEKVQQRVGFPCYGVGGQAADDDQGNHVVGCNGSCLPLGYQPEHQCNGEIDHGPAGADLPKRCYEQVGFTHR